MINRPWSDAELIELLSEELPEELSREQVDALRQAIRDNPAVRQALIEELHLEQVVATHLAPAGDDPDAVVSRIEELSRRRHRSRWIGYGLILLIGSVLAGVIAGVINHNRTPAGPPNQPQVAHSGGTTPGTTDAGKQGSTTDTTDTARPHTGSTAVVQPGTGGSATKIADATGTNPQHTDVPPVKPPVKVQPATVAFDPPWRLYDDAAARGDVEWINRVENVLRPIGGARLAFNERERYYDIRGRFELLPPTAPVKSGEAPAGDTSGGRVIRLRFSDLRKLAMTFWHGNEATRVALGDARNLVGSHVTREPGAEPRPAGMPENVDEVFLREQIVDRVDPTIDFAWAGRSPSPKSAPEAPGNDFAVRWTGRLVVPQRDMVHFFLTSDDGSILTIDGRRVIENWDKQSAAERDAMVMLDAGEHDIVVEYFQDTGESSIKLEWETKTIARQVIPSSALRTAAGPDGKPGLLGRYCYGARIATGEHDTEQVVCDDNFRWRALREGTIDIRYQDKSLIVSRGAIVLLSVPMASAPDRAVAEVDGRLRLAETLRFEKPLPIAPVATPAPQADDQSLSWRVSPAAAEQPVALTVDNGTVRFERQSGESDWRATAGVALRGGIEVTFNVTDATPGAGFFMTSPTDGVRVAACIGEIDGRRVLCTNANDRGDIQRRIDRNTTVGDTFRVRATLAIDYLALAYSVDGRNWLPLDVRPYSSADRSVSPQAQFGLWLAGQQGDRRITISDVKVTRFAAIEHLADASLADRVPVIDLDNASRARGDDRYEALLAAAPKQVDEPAWRLACAASVLKWPAPPALRRDAAFDLVEQAIRQGAALDDVLPALVELPRRIWLTRNDDHPAAWRRLQTLYDALALRLWNDGQADAMTRLVDTWHAQDAGPGARDLSLRYVAPPALTRLRLLDRFTRNDLPALRDAALEADYLSQTGSGWGNDEERRSPTMTLASWMLAHASQRLTDAPPPAVGVPGNAPPRWPAHPLVVDTDRESTNMVAEFLASVDTGAIDHACRILTRDSVPSGIAPVDLEGRLFKSTHVLLRQAIDGNETLGKTLREQYEAMGLLRLRQAMDQNRWESMESLATQFHGTAAAYRAEEVLANRDLAMGNFFSAAARYESLLPLAPDNEKSQIEAKRRLALAMTGEAVGEPVSAPVAMPSATISPDEFESLIKSLVRERRGGLGAEAPPSIGEWPAPPPPPASRDAALSHLIDLSPAAERRGDLDRMRQIGWAIVDGKLLLHQHAKCTAIDLAKRSVLWRYEDNGAGLPAFAARPSTPLVAGDHVYLNFLRDRHIELTCLAAADGQPVWRQALDDGIVSDPILVGPWLYVLSIRRQLGDYVDLVLRRISPTTGESVLDQALVRMRYSEAVYLVGRPTLVGDTLIFRSGGAMVACDLLGRTRWIRRLPYIPPSAYPPLSDAVSIDDMTVIDGRFVIASSPGSPSVVCVDARNGELAWTYVQPMLRRVVGEVAGMLVLAANKHLEGVDVHTGKRLWRTKSLADPQAILPAGKQTVLTLTLDRAVANASESRGSDLVREARWLSAIDGSTVRTVELPELADNIFDPGRLISDGRVILALTSVPAQGDASARLALLEPTTSTQRAVTPAPSPAPPAAVPALALTELAKNRVALGAWHSVGPFAGSSMNDAYQRSFGPEQKIDLATTYDNDQLKWVAQPDWSDGKVQTLAGNQSATYLYRTMDAPADGRVTLSLGSDDAMRVWVNGSEVLSRLVGRGVAPDQDRVTVALRKGRNEILIKIVNGPERSGFFFDVR